MSGKGWYWPVGLAALLVGSAAANLALVFITARDASFAVEPNYYAKALAWDERMAEQSRSDALGWSVALRVEPAGSEGRMRVTARLVDKSKTSVEGARVEVEAFHNARARRILRAAFAPAGETYATEMAIDKPGLWEFRLRATRAADTFVATVVADVQKAP